ncbi:MAG: hypothetical protein RRY10_03740, partial [Christensenellaceae bacterium]
RRARITKQCGQAASKKRVDSTLVTLSQLPFADLFYLYLENPLAALSQPLMIFAILLSVAAIIIITLVFPFWYAFTYHTYKNAEFEYNRKYKGEKINESNCKCTRQG